MATVRSTVFTIAAVAICASAQHALAQNAETVASEAPVQSALPGSIGDLKDLRLARPLSRNEEMALKPLDQFRECERCPEMTIIPAGRFMMGAKDGESGSTPDERPRHRVDFAKPFAIGRFPVTVNQWDACVGAGACRYRPADQGRAGGMQPATNLLWDDAREYVAWLSRTTGRPYRLPSEAEREYVARAGTTTVYWWGDAFAAALANCDPGPGNRQVIAASVGDVQPVLAARPLPVQTFAANPWGLYQVHGNVYDWVEDCWNDDYNGAPSDGSAWISGNCNGHVLRGGAFSRSAQAARSAARLWSGPPNRMIYMSVRVARTMER